MLSPLVDSEDVNLRRGAMTLAGLWHVEPLRATLEKTARHPDMPDALRQSACDALAEMGGDASVGLLKKLSKPGQGTAASRAIAISALARLDVESAASFAAAQVPL